MANRKLTVLPELTSFEDDDWDYVVDKSDISESPQGTSKKARKSTLWDYIRSKTDARYGTVVEIVNQRYAGAGQNYTLPNGAIAIEGHINDAVQFPEDPSYISDLNTFTQTDATVTFKKTIIAGQRIRIKFYI